MLCGQRESLSPDPDGITLGLAKVIFTGPAIAPVLCESFGTGPGYFKVDMTNLTSSGFEIQEKPMVAEADNLGNCE